MRVRPAVTAPPTTLRVPAALVASTSAARRRVTATTAAACSTPSQPTSAASTEAASVMSPFTTSAGPTRWGSNTRDTLPGSRARRRTSWPASVRATVAYEPRKPVPPVTRMRTAADSNVRRR